MITSLPSLSCSVSPRSTGAPIHTQEIQREAPLFASIFPFLSFLRNIVRNVTALTFTATLLARQPGRIHPPCHLASASTPCRHLSPTHGPACLHPSPAPSQLPMGRSCLLGTKPTLSPYPLTPPSTGPSPPDTGKPWEYQFQVNCPSPPSPAAVLRRSHPPHTDRLSGQRCSPNWKASVLFRQFGFRVPVPKHKMSVYRTNKNPLYTKGNHKPVFSAAACYSQRNTP